MLARRSPGIAVVLLTLTVALSQANAWPHKLGKKARVTFVAAGTLIRGTWGQNEDTYLVSLVFSKGTEPVLARLVDTYPNEWPSISFDALTAPGGTVMRVKRDPRCDVLFGQMPLRAAPGDLMAVLPVKLTYRPQLERLPPPNAVLPCYHRMR